MQETQVPSLGQEDAWRREWLLTPVFLPGESHGLRSLAGYSPQGHKQSDTTEAQRLISKLKPFHLTGLLLTCITEWLLTVYKQICAHISPPPFGLTLA